MNNKTTDQKKYSAFSLLQQWYLILLLCLPLLAGCDSGMAFSKDNPVYNFTKTHTRVVWVQDQGDGADTFANSTNLRLIGFDSNDSKGERYLLKETGSYFKPLFTPDGKKVVVTDRRKKIIYLVDWQKGGKKMLHKGQALEVWQDPADKKVWVYFLDGIGKENFYFSQKSLYRFPLNKPKKKELVWKKTDLSWSNFQLSRDGSLAGGLFPWPHAGVFYPKENRWQKFGRGCWTSLSPDNSRLLWIFDGLHRNLTLFQTDSGEKWQVNINNAPDMKGYEIYHPRWTNHPQYLVATGPYMEGEGGNKIRGGGKKVEIYLGQFDDTFRSVKRWLKVSSNSKGDFYPDVWIDKGDTVSIAPETFGKAANVASTQNDWPITEDNLIFIWENLKGKNQLSEKSPVGFMQFNVKARGQAMFGRFLDMIINQGWFETGKAGEKIGGALHASNKFSIEMVISPHDIKKAKGLVLEYGSTSKNGVRIYQEKADLVLSLKPAGGGEEKSFRWQKAFRKNEPSHVLLSWNDEIMLYINGVSMGVKDTGGLQPKDLDLKELTFGSPDSSWQGRIDSVALYNSVIDAETAAQSYDSLSKQWQKRPTVSRLVVSAKPEEQTSVPDPDDLGAYRRAMVVNVYNVEKVIKGKYEEDKIVVAEWAILDRQDITKKESSKKNRTLVLEKFDDHPELEGERLFMDIFEPDLDVYYLAPRLAKKP